MRQIGLIIYCLIFSAGSYPSFSQIDVSKYIKINGEYVGGVFNANPGKHTAYSKPLEDFSEVAKSSKHLIDLLKNAKPGTRIFLPSHIVFDLSNYKNIVIPRDITIFSDRGKNRSLGALIFTDSLATSPLFQVLNDNVKIFGIRFKGPDGNIAHPLLEQKISKVRGTVNEVELGQIKAYGIPNSSCFNVTAKNVVIENCEIFHWSYAGILIRHGGDALVTHSYIHHNQRAGLGYGVCVDDGIAIIKGNLFDFNRHAIAGTGTPGSSYTAAFNVVLANATSHAFDMHGGKNRGDGTDIAGDSIVIHDNLFFVNNQRPIVISGKPKYKSKIYDNDIIFTKRKEVKWNSIKRLKSNNFYEIRRYIAQVNSVANIVLEGNRTYNY